MAKTKLKLSIELIPESQHGSNLRAILTAKEWDICKATASKESGGVCSICGGKGRRWPVECHEQWTYRYNKKALKENLLDALYLLDESYLKCTSFDKVNFYPTDLPEVFNKIFINSSTSARDWKKVRRNKLMRHSLLSRSVKLLSDAEALTIYFRARPNKDLEYGIQKLVGLIALCPSCHEVKHFGRAQVLGKEAVVRKRLMKINDWDAEEVQEYIELKSRQYHDRCNISWSLDLSWIVEHREIGQSLSNKTLTKLGIL